MNKPLPSSVGINDTYDATINIPDTSDPNQSIEYQTDKTYQIVGYTLGGITLLFLLIGAIMGIYRIIQKKKERDDELQSWMYGGDEEIHFMIGQDNRIGRDTLLEEKSLSMHTIATATASYKLNNASATYFDPDSPFSHAVKLAALIPNSPPAELPDSNLP